MVLVHMDCDFINKNKRGIPNDRNGRRDTTTESGERHDRVAYIDVGFAVTRQHKGYQDIKQFLAEDNKTIILTQKWDPKDDHQAFEGPR